MKQLLRMNFFNENLGHRTIVCNSRNIKRTIANESVGASSWRSDRKKETSRVSGQGIGECPEISSREGQVGIRRRPSERHWMLMVMPLLFTIGLRREPGNLKGPLVGFRSCNFAGHNELRG
jgi:hypothetical protein